MREVCGERVFRSRELTDTDDLINMADAEAIGRWSLQLQQVEQKPFV